MSILFAKTEGRVLRRAPVRAVGVISAALLGAGLFLPVAPAQAETFVISPAEGYGITDCLVSGGACGSIVADAWCEAHGLSHASAFGPAEDITGSAEVQRVSVVPGSFVVVCDR